ncbi:MAG TPA: arylamine N-acetyltransferase, partial [Anaerolineales bacterium]|nr:arylamine N-acetyltransferase [Anaerolineales bacterium]
MNIQAYLNRIEYPHRAAPDLITLQGLHLAHMLTVPFENLDISLKRLIRIDEQSLWNKIVVGRRGGFCYELNGLFAWLLKQIGFNVTYLNARVFNRAGELGIEFDHLALLVKAPDQLESWLVDVGFGDSFTNPLAFEDRGEREQGLRAYRVEEVPGGYVTWQKNYDGLWDRLYYFDTQPRTFPRDYEAGCVYHQTSPDTSFTRSSIISRVTLEGRVSLEDGWLIVTSNGQRTERPLKDETEYRVLLKEYFAISELK